MVEEKIVKLYGICLEFFKEKELNLCKVLFLNEVLEVIIVSNEEIVDNLKIELLIVKKEFLVINSVFDRR